MGRHPENAGSNPVARSTIFNYERIAMLFPQLGKLRNWLELKPEILKELDHPTFRNEEDRPTSQYFYHTTVGSLLFNSSLVQFVGKRLNLSDRPEEFEYYYTAFHNATLFNEVLAKTGVMEKVRIGPRFRAHLTKQELFSLYREYYFGLVSLMHRYGNCYWVGVLTEQFFIHYLFSITFPTKFRRSVQEWCLAVAEVRYGAGLLRESIKMEGEGVIFSLLAGNDSLITLQGNSIKTLRRKAYKALLVRLLDINPIDKESAVEVIRIRSGEELPTGLLEQLDMTPWGDDADEGDAAVELRLSPRRNNTYNSNEI